MRVYEFTGEVVGAYGGSEIPINDLCTIAEEDPQVYPMLSGVDPYDDTTFNPRQARRLGEELRTLTDSARSAEIRKIATELGEIVSLLAQEPGRPHHRRLVFLGD